MQLLMEKSHNLSQQTCILQVFSFLSVWRLLPLHLTLGFNMSIQQTHSSAGLHSALVWYMWGRRIRGQVSSCSQRGGHCPRRLLQLVSCHQTKALLIANSWTAKGLANERRDGVMVFCRVARPNREEPRPALCPRISPRPATAAPAGPRDPEDLSRAAAAFGNKLSEGTELHMQRWITVNITGRQQGDWGTIWREHVPLLYQHWDTCMAQQLDDIGQCDVTDGCLWYLGLISV